jgi:hypothetical protein
MALQTHKYEIFVRAKVIRVEKIQDNYYRVNIILKITDMHCKY